MPRFVDETTYFGATGRNVAKAGTQADARQAIGAASPADVEQAVTDADIPGQVTSAVASDETVVEAAAMAVDSEIAGRNIAELVPRYTSEPQGGLIGENGRLTDLVVDAEGRVLDATIDRWRDRMGMVETEDSVWWGTGFAAEDGRLTELVVGKDGKVPSFVLQAWRDRMAVSDPVRILLPSSLYLVAGMTYHLEYRKFVANFDPSFTVTVSGPSTGTGNYGEYWEYTPASAGTSTLSVQVKDRTGTVLDSASVPVEVLVVDGSGVNHLAIGDSITRVGTYVSAAVDELGGTTVGTRTFDDGAFSREGRNGWRLSFYTERIGESSGGDSPFLFPVGVDGDKYWGNVSFWKSVIAGDDGDPNYAGFELIAKGWDSGGSYLFDNSTGYPLSPSPGDVVVDPTKPAGQEFQEWSGSSWSAMSPQPDVELSFPKYMARFAAAFANPPTSISILLATNDFMYDTASWAGYKARLDLLIASIRDWDADVPIILCGAPSPGPATNWATQTVNHADFNRRMVKFTANLYADYDTDEARAENVYVTSFLGTVSDVNMVDHVHPKDPDGYEQMAPWLTGVLAHLVDEGVI